MLKPISSAWQDVYHANLLNALTAPEGELINHTFMIATPENRKLVSKTRNFNEEFSKLMFDWILTGSPLVTEEMLAMNPNAKNYPTIFSKAGLPLMSVAYGGRIMEQLPHVLDILRETGGTTRRAEIMILKAEDIHVGLALERGQTKCEYPCTLGMNFRIRGGRLDMAVSMRSNNYTTTVCQDFYVFTLLQEYVAKLLSVPMGVYYHHAQSGHVFDQDRVRAKLIISEYINDAGMTDEQIAIWGGLYEIT